MRLQIRCHLSRSLSESLTGVGGFFPTWLTHSHGCWLEASVPHCLFSEKTYHMDFSMELLECPHDIADSFPWSEQFKREQSKKLPRPSWFILRSHIPSLLLSSIGHTDQPWHNVGGGDTIALRNRKCGHWSHLQGWMPDSANTYTFFFIFFF